MYIIHLRGLVELQGAGDAGLKALECSLYYVHLRGLVELQGAGDAGTLLLAYYSHSLLLYMARQIMHIKCTSAAGLGFGPSSPMTKGR
jgi:hypothetical protein